MALLVAEIHWPGADVDPSAAIAERLGVAPAEVVEWQLIRRSVDGRRRCVHSGGCPSYTQTTARQTTCVTEGSA